MESTCHISIAICTWNRCALLRQTLKSLQKLAVPNDVDWEVIVVDNNSTDSTSVIAQQFASELPIRYVLEENQGLCHARNRALAESHGEYIAFIDDDVIVHTNWLTDYLAAGRRWPDSAYFTGKVMPWFENQPSEAVATVMNELAGVEWLGYDLGREERRLLATEGPRGANMMYRKRLIKDIYFDQAFGRQKNEVIFGDESDFCSRIHAKGLYGVWVPNAALEHYVPKARTEKKYLRNFFIGLGISMVRKKQVASGRKVCNVPRWILLKYFEMFFVKYLHLIKHGKTAYFRDLTHQWRFLGVMKEFASRRTSG